MKTIVKLKSREPYRRQLEHSGSGTCFGHYYTEISAKLQVCTGGGLQAGDEREDTGHERRDNLGPEQEDKDKEQW